MSVLLLIDIAAMGAISLAVKFLGHRPERRYKWEPINGDLEQGSSAYPMVLVQIPMYNEKEVKTKKIKAFPFFILNQSRTLASSYMWYLVK
jgi:beta-mannan synthase